MDRLNKNETNLVIQYLDHKSIQNLVKYLMTINPKQAYDIMLYIMNEMIREREEIEYELKILTAKLESIEDLSNELNNIIE